MGENDFLTNVRTREAIEGYVDKLISHRTPFALVFIDLNNFKLINDVHGHSTGDIVLAQFGSFLNKSFRSEDIVGRFGGDEFIIILPRTSLTNATKIVNRFLSKTNSTEFASFKIDFSYGIAIFPKDGTSFAKLIDKADKKMYEGKMQGNVTVLEERKGKSRLAGRSIEKKLAFSKLKDSLNSKGSLLVISGSEGIGKKFFANTIVEQAKFLSFEVIESVLTVKDEQEAMGFFKHLMNEKMQTQFDQKIHSFSKFKQLGKFEDIIFNIVTELLIEESSKKPILISLQNINYIDAVSLEFLPKFLEKIKNKKILLIGIYKGSSQEKFGHLFKNNVNLFNVELRPLNLEETKIMLSDLLVAGQISSDFVETVYKYSGGIPLLINYIVKTLVKNKNLIRTKDGLSLSKTFDFMRANTDSIAQFILNSVEPDERKLLEWLALEEEKIPSVTVYRIIDELGFNYSVQYKSLLEKNILREENDYIFFTYPIVRDYLTQRLSSVQKRLMHKKIALLEKQLGDEKIYLNVANHLLLAGELKQSISYLTKYAQFEEKNMSYFTAVEVYKRIYGLVQDGPPTGKIARKIISLLVKIDRGNEAIEFYEESYKYLRNSQDCNLLKELADAYEETGNYSKSLAILDTALKKKCSKNASVEIKLSMCWIQYAQGKHNKAEEIFKEIDVDGCDEATLANYYNIKGILLLEEHKYNESLRFLKAGLTIALENNPQKVTSIKNNMAIALQETGSIEESLEMFKETLEEYKRLYNEYGESIANYNIGDTYLTIGDYADALKYYEGSIKIDKAIKNEIGIGYCALGIGMATLLTGDLKRAEANIKSAQKIFKRLGAEREWKTATLELAKLYVRMGLYDKALSIFLKLQKLQLTEAEQIQLLLRKTELFIAKKSINEISLMYSDLNKFNLDKVQLELRREALEMLKRAAQILKKENDVALYESELQKLKIQVVAHFKNENLKQFYLSKKYF
ncbi:MAG: diguanylate cyclase domain-containing protein [Caldisericaceae bacterium]